MGFGVGEEESGGSRGSGRDEQILDTFLSCHSRKNDFMSPLLVVVVVPYVFFLASNSVQLAYPHIFPRFFFRLFFPRPRSCFVLWPMLALYLALFGK